MISEENKVIILKRIKSFLWRVGMLGVIAGLNFTAANLNLFNLPAEVVIIASLVLSEITKQLNNSVSVKRNTH